MEKQKNGKRFQQIFIIFIVALQCIFHYYFLVRYVGIEKTADWADYAVVPLLLSLLLIIGYYTRPLLGLRLFTPLNILVTAWILFSVFYHEYFHMTPSLAIFSEMSKSLNRATAAHLWGLFGVRMVLASALITAMFICAFFIRAGEAERRIRSRIWLVLLLIIGTV